MLHPPLATPTAPPRRRTSPARYRWTLCVMPPLPVSRDLLCLTGVNLGPDGPRDRPGSGREGEVVSPVPLVRNGRRGPVDRSVGRYTEDRGGNEIFVPEWLADRTAVGVRIYSLVFSSNRGTGGRQAASLPRRLVPAVPDPGWGLGGHESRTSRTPVSGDLGLVSS